MKKRGLRAGRELHAAGILPRAAADAATSSQLSRRCSVKVSSGVRVRVEAHDVDRGVAGVVKYASASG